MTLATCTRGHIGPEAKCLEKGQKHKKHHPDILKSMSQQLVLYERGKKKSVGGRLFGQAATFEEQCRKLRKKMRERRNEAEEIQKSLA